MKTLGTDAVALRNRIEAHRRFSSRELEPWLLGLLRPRPGERVLDLGCGTGKQSLPLARSVGPSGEVVGLDVSAAALAQAGEAVRAEGLANLRFVEDRLEDMDQALSPDARFDAMLCSFALYYSRDPEATLRAARARLVEGGRALVCGPARDNNRAFVDLCESVVPRGAQPERIEASLGFMEDAGPRLFRRLFGCVEVHRFENPLTFPQPEDVMAYWRSYHLHSPSHEAELRRAVQARFAAHGAFTTVKVVLGALMR